MLSNEGFVITRPRKTAYLLIVVCCLVGAGGVVFAQRSAIVSQLSEWRLLHEREGLTELYFTDYTNLPKSLAAGSQHTIAFTVHNLEHRATTYHYKLVAASQRGTEKTLGSGTFMLDHDDVRRGSADIIVPAFDPQLAIKVELYYQGIEPHHTAETIRTQVIDFSAAITNSSAGKAVI